MDLQRLEEVGGDLASLRRWLLRQLEPPDGPLIVLLRPTEWFGAATDVPGLLRQVADCCRGPGRKGHLAAGTEAIGSKVSGEPIGPRGS